jgi:hypothetical protein
MRCANTIATRVTLATSLMMVAWAASADGVDGITTSFSGYGTVGGTFTSDGKYAYVHNSTEFTGASNSFDVGLDSRIGVQAVVNFDPQWSITAQEEAKLRGSSEFDPGTEWLYAQYQPEPALKLRLGRVVLPTFLASDTINVGYAVPWFRAPNEVYASEPFDYLDGAQVIWQHAVGPFQLNLEISYGDTQANFSAESLSLSARSKSTFNGAVSLSWRDLLLRYSETDLRTVFSVPFNPVTLTYNLHDQFHCLGLQYDNGKALLTSEWVKRDENNLPGFDKPFAREIAWYTAAGWRLGKFTPLVMYSVLDLDASVISPAVNYATWAASLRYDVVRNVDLKLQVSRAQANNGIEFVNAIPTVNQRVNVYSFGADFVF